MRVLVACEFSGTVREAFKALGHDVWSCDLLPTEIPGQHIQGDVLEILNQDWDLMIAHPPCTDLAVSGARYFSEKIADGRQQRALDFVQALMNAPIPRICIENPVSVISTKIRKPDQIIQPYQFGHPEPKSTCLWLKNLPKLVPTNIVEPEFIIGKKDGKKYSRIHFMSYGKKGAERWRLRSKTYQGIAEAMANTWG